MLVTKIKLLEHNTFLLIVIFLVCINLMSSFYLLRNSIPRVCPFVCLILGPKQNILTIKCWIFQIIGCFSQPSTYMQFSYFSPCACSSIQLSLKTTHNTSHFSNFSTSFATTIPKTLLYNFIKCKWFGLKAFI